MTRWPNRGKDDISGRTPEIQQIMINKILIWFGISFGLLFVLFLIFKILTWGISIYDLERWAPSGHIEEQFEGSFRPILNFSGKSKRTTIIPFVLSRTSSRPTNKIGIRKTPGGAYGYDYNRFEYVRFTRFEVHYESGHVQKLLKNNLSFKEKKFKVFSPKSGSDTTSLFKFDLDRIEKCTIVVEGYSKLIEGDNEEFFRLTKGYHIRKYWDIRTGRQSFHA